MELVRRGLVCNIDLMDSRASQGAAIGLAISELCQAGVAVGPAQPIRFRDEVR